jgi:hypothetical protein
VNWAGLVVGFGVLMAAWLALWLVTAMAVRLLPPSSVRTAVSFLPATVTFSYRLLRHPLVPRRPRFVLLLGFLYAKVRLAGEKRTKDDETNRPLVICHADRDDRTDAVTVTRGTGISLPVFSIRLDIEHLIKHAKPSTM